MNLFPESKEEAIQQRLRDAEIYERKGMFKVAERCRKFAKDLETEWIGEEQI